MNSNHRPRALDRRFATDALPPALARDPRYHVVGEVGRGGMGVVYDAFDRETCDRVAIKVLSSRREGLLRFKNEYRLASRLAHPNLIALYDLTIAGDAAYFAMEYAPGVDLRRYVRAADRAHLPRLCASAAQILDALESLAAAGIVHRDLKPSNVMVGPDGQVRLLDFGLAGAADTPDFADAMLAGTPTYMSPEQIDRLPLGPASDLYALGAIVYELIAGEPPFIGPLAMVLDAHRSRYPLPLSDRVEDVPPALELWCLRLLAKRPEERFSSPREAREALEACGAPSGRAPRGSGLLPALRELPLIGRAAELGALRALFSESRRNPGQFALVTGESGIGKTALAEALAKEAAGEGAIVLRGSCREDETVAYNAFDAVVDSAATMIERWLASGAVGSSELPLDREELALVARLFPVLRELLPETPPRAAPAGGAGAERERAFAILRRVVAQVTATQPLVLLLDDLHWADEDSLALLGHLLGPEGVRGLLVIATAWPISNPSHPLARFMRHARDYREAGRHAITEVRLRPLPPAEAAQVVETALGGSSEFSHSLGLHKEAAGNPFLLVELSRLQADDPTLLAPTVAEVARRRLALLSEDEAALVELAALSAGPIDAGLLRSVLAADSRALALDGGDFRRLCGLKILRHAGAGRVGDPDRYDFYHHRIREAIRAQVPPDRQRKLHLRLAETLAMLRPDDPEALLRELLLAGQEARAAVHAEAAADAAATKLAHARAVPLYELALRHGLPARSSALRGKLALALESCARFAEAAEQYRLGLGDPMLKGLGRARAKLHLANCQMHTGDLERSGPLIDEALTELGHPPAKSSFRRALTVFGLLLRVVFASWWRRGPRVKDDERTSTRLFAYSVAVPCYQFTSRNVEQLECALRYRLLGARSASLEARYEAEAMALILLIPFAHLGKRTGRWVAAHFRRLEADAPRVATDRARQWLPLLRAVYAVVAGRPDRAIAHFEALDALRLGRAGYLALQRQNALFLAGDYARYCAYVERVAEASGSPLTPLDQARLAYVARLRGDLATAHRLTAQVEQIAPESLPWTHRSLFTYQLVELKLYDRDTTGAARLARSLVGRIRRGAISPSTGAFESADAVARAFLAEAGRLWRTKEAAAIAQAHSLVDQAARALEATPLVASPLFSARLLHDRALVACARGKTREGVRLLELAERRSRTIAVPCFRLRLLEDLLELLEPGDPKRARIAGDAAQLACRYDRSRRPTRAPWLLPFDAPSLR